MRAAGSRPGPPATGRGRTPELSAPQVLVDRRIGPARSWPAPETLHRCSALPGRSTGSSLRSHASWWLSVLECAHDPPNLHTGPGLAIADAVAPERDDLCMPGISLGGRRGCRRLGGIAAVPRG